ncbi:HAD-IIA family hydrolase [Evansella tamaricis]|uniref:HAD-IIA family hydrolase n=1 Tax=Evansella tamaricis TaxID=2069301 RepID=A0ABS6JE35_9BACI|nr:HAD-IIA family hydrolase [Evansella tamaricis]MBU9711906.1 HAD-IIA family hydrolase [Evansella tamaricis]
MKEYNTFIFDIDGTIVKQDEEIVGAIKLLSFLKESGNHVLFATNNPTTTKEKLAARLNTIGFSIQPDEIITPIDAFVLFLQEINRETLIFPLITESVRGELEKRGIRFCTGRNQELITHVLLGMNDQFTYEQFCEALRYLDHGAELVLLNEDIYCPIPDGRIPDSGALSSVLTSCTGKPPLSVGKPTEWMQKTLVDKIHSPLENCLFIGDSHVTDIQMGHSMGMDTCIVQSGVSLYSGNEVMQGISPTYTMKDCMELHHFIQKRKECSCV